MPEGTIAMESLKRTPLWPQFYCFDTSLSFIFPAQQKEHINYSSIMKQNSLLSVRGSFTVLPFKCSVDLATEVSEKQHLSTPWELVRDTGSQAPPRLIESESAFNKISR